jgi:hypothetical protein
LILGEIPGLSALIGGVIVLASVTLKCVFTVMPLKTILGNKKGQAIEKAPEEKQNSC